MAGYIGSKAVSLSTTAADVTGDAEIGGDLTVDTNTLYVDSTNNQVGIGTSSPSATMHLKATSGNTGLYIQDASGSPNLSFLDSAGTIQWQIYSTMSGLTGLDPLVFYSSGGERMRIDSSGNVGIGTDSPQTALDVGGSSPTIRAQFSHAASQPLSGFEIDSGLGFYTALRMETDSNGVPYSQLDFDGYLKFIDGGSSAGGGSERMRIDNSGNLLVGKTTTDNNTVGAELNANGSVVGCSDNVNPAMFNRKSSDGDIAVFRKDNSTVGSIGVFANDEFYIEGGSGISGFGFLTGRIIPRKGSTGYVDNEIDLGQSNVRFDDIYATNGTIQTSDQNEKQQIASLTDAEMTAAKAISKLFKTFKWNDSVAEKGDAARTHAGVIAQDVEQAMTDAGLNAGDYAFFISTTWWETQTEVPAVEAVEAQDAVYEDVIIPAVEEVLDEEGNVVTEAQPERTEQRLVTEAVEAVEAQEAYTRTDTYDTLEEAPEGATERNRKGIRYPELLSFIGAATEQRLASIETRLDALEAN